jgi:hypothetical protein
MKKPRNFDEKLNDATFIWWNSRQMQKMIDAMVVTIDTPDLPNDLVSTVVITEGTIETNMLNRLVVEIWWEENKILLHRVKEGDGVDGVLICAYTLDRDKIITITNFLNFLRDVASKYDHMFWEK